MTRPYRPSNGTEGIDFQENFCVRCARDAEFQRTQENGCPIIVASMAHNIDEPGFPAEWVEDDDGSNPRCLAFEAETDSDHYHSDDRRQLPLV